VLLCEQSAVENRDAAASRDAQTSAGEPPVAIVRRLLGVELLCSSPLHKKQPSLRGGNTVPDAAIFEKNKEIPSLRGEAVGFDAAIYYE